MSQGVLGPIPWDKIRDYAYYIEIEKDMVESFIQIIREMDSGYLEYQSKKNGPKPSSK